MLQSLVGCTPLECRDWRRRQLLLGTMAQKISEFHYSTVFIDAAAFVSADRLHDELAFKLGLPKWYGRN